MAWRNVVPYVVLVVGVGVTFHVRNDDQARSIRQNQAAIEVNREAIAVNQATTLSGCRADQRGWDSRHEIILVVTEALALVAGSSANGAIIAQNAKSAEERIRLLERGGKRPLCPAPVHLPVVPGQ